ncbi:MAG: DUF1194 domain-containing protein [Kiloniellaceae bacterium]
MRLNALILAAGIAVCGALPRPAPAVDLALVLLNDVSQSMDNGEYALVKDGYRAAFADPEVIAALIGNRGGVAVAYVEFSGKNDVTRVLDWQVLSDAASARAFGEAVAAAPRSSVGNTSLAGGLAAAARMLQESGFTAARRVIDIASDHPHDGGRCEPIRDAAVAAGITINALPIVDERQIGTIDGRLAYSEARWGSESVIDFYRRTVVGGPGSFAVEARSYAVFGEALKRKLLLELIAAPPDRAAGTLALAVEN